MSASRMRTVLRTVFLSMSASRMRSRGGPRRFAVLFLYVELRGFCELVTRNVLRPSQFPVPVLISSPGCGCAMLQTARTAARLTPWPGLSVVGVGAPSTRDRTNSRGLFLEPILFFDFAEKEKDQDGAAAAPAASAAVITSPGRKKSSKSSRMSAEEILLVLLLPPPKYRLSRSRACSLCLQWQLHLSHDFRVTTA